MMAGFVFFAFLMRKFDPGAHRMSDNVFLVPVAVDVNKVRFPASTFSGDPELAPLSNCTADVRIRNEGSLYLVHPLTAEAEEWFATNLDAADRFGNAVVVERL